MLNSAAKGAMVQAELMAGEAKRAYDSVAALYQRSLELRDDIQVSSLVSIYFFSCNPLGGIVFAMGSLRVNPVGVVPETSVECLYRQLSLYIWSLLLSCP